MRITFLSDWMRRGAGVSVALANLAEALAAGGHEVTLCGSDAAGVEAVLGRPAPFECTPLPPLGRGAAARARAVMALRPAIERTRADVYVPVTFPFERLAGRLGAPTVLYDQRAIPAAGGPPPPVAAALVRVQAAARRARRRPAGVVTVSHWLAQQIDAPRRARAV